MRKKPDDLLSTCCQVLHGVGGYSAIIGNEWFHYRRGRLQVHSVEYMNKIPGLYIEEYREATPEDIDYFHKLDGDEWNLDACKTRIFDKI